MLWPSSARCSSRSFRFPDPTAPPKHSRRCLPAVAELLHPASARVRAQQRQNQSNTRSSFTPPQSSFLPRIRATTLCSPRSVQSAAAQRVQRSHANNMLGAAVIRPLPGGKRGFSGWTVCLYVFVESRINPRATGVHRSNALKHGEERREIHLIQGTMPNGSPAACVQPLLQQGGAPRRAGGGRRVGSQCHEAQDGRNLHHQPLHNVASKVLLYSSLLPRTSPRNAPHNTQHPRAERPTPLASKSVSNVLRM